MSTRRYCYREKIPYPDAETAERKRQIIAAYNTITGKGRPGMRLGVYFCRRCKAHHLGHRPEPQTLESTPCTKSEP